ncbi:MAG: PQQ-binding-like beta-propeller repeat protein [Spirochaetales bacterium]|nr:PQQ-binding-like beta-propeller repeat protein [Spirochaetales bacterium]
MKIDKPELILSLTRSLFGIGVTAVIFSALVGLLSAAAFFQLKLRDPLASPALVVLYERLRENPEDRAIKDEIRDLDLLARRAYFASRGQVTSGGILVFAGTAVFVLSFAAREALRRKLPASPRGKPQPALPAVRLRARVLVAAGGIALLAGAFLLVFAVAPFMDSFRMAAAVPEKPAANGAPPESASPASAAPAAPVEAAWPNYRGPGGRLIAPPGEYPTAWNGATGEGIVWQAKPRLPGNNSPVVFGGRVFVSGADKTGAEIYGYDAAEGKLLFTARVAFSPAGRAAKVDEKYVGYAAPTLAADGRYVAGIFAGGDVVCLDHDGKILWQKNLGTPLLNYGYASSPIVWNGLLIVQLDWESSPRLLALDLASGEPRWETKQDVFSSWASPVVGESRGKPAVFVSTNPYVAAYDAATGAELWSADVMTGEIGSSPAFADGVVFAGNETAVLAAFTADDGKQLWEYYEDLPSVASPAVKDGLLFMASAAGAVTCVDAATGKAVWREEFTDGFYSSPVIAGDKLYLTDREGVTHILGAARAYAPVTACSLGEPVDATPAFADNRIYIRGKTNLYCVGK